MARPCLAGLAGSVALDGDAPSFALFRPVIPDRPVHTAAIVPEGHIIECPAKAYLVIDMLGLFKQHRQDSIAFFW